MRCEAYNKNNTKRCGNSALRGGHRFCRTHLDILNHNGIEERDVPRNVPFSLLVYSALKKDTKLVDALAICQDHRNGLTNLPPSETRYKLEQRYQQLEQDMLDKQDPSECVSPAMYEELQKLLREQTSLRQKCEQQAPAPPSSELIRLRAEADRLREEASEVARLREELASLKQREEEIKDLPPLECTKIGRASCRER